MKILDYLFIITLCIFALLIPMQTHAATKGIDYESINTDWQFYDQQLLTEAGGRLADTIVDLPVEFEEITGEVSTYGTFVKEITISKQDVGKNLALEIPYIYGAMKIYANGQLLTEVGTVGTSANEHDTDLKPLLLPVTFNEHQITLAVQLSSFQHIRGGFSEGFKLGEWDELSKAYYLERMVVSFVTGVVLVVGVLSFVIGLLAKGQQLLLTFGFFCTGVAIRSVFSVPFIYHDLPFDISYIWATKMEYMTTNLVFLLYVWFIYLLFKELVSKVIIYGSVSILATLAIISLVTEPVFFQTLFFRTSFLMLAFVVYSVGIIILALKRNLELAKPLFLGVIFVFIGLIIDLLSGMGYMTAPPMSLYTIAGNVLLILFFIGYRHAKQLILVKKLNEELLEMNKTLEDKVQQRTQQLTESNKRLSELALIDGLTGIHNRHTFNELLNQYFHKAKKTYSQLGLLLIDVDEFKKYNDYYGHVLGDELLKNIVQLIQTNLPQNVKFARYGGEEFAIILPNYSKESLWQIAEEIRLLVKEAQFEHLGRKEGIVTISVGGVELTAEDNVENELIFIEIADQRLYISKHNGRDCVTFDSSSTSLKA